ncbi:MAG: YbbR-like domain-containing protein [Bacteroidetes bacterium]|nr:YbbR-like domain-containing protein [Bacteroidota bacterium]
MSNQQHTVTKRPFNYTAFFICVIIALGLWLLRWSASEKIFSDLYKVSFSNLPNSKLPVNSLPEAINVTYKSNVLNYLFSSFSTKKEINLNFNTLVSVGSNYVITSNNLPNFLQKKSTQISPDTLYFIEQKGFKKQVVIKSNIKVNCSFGYAANKPILTPQTITIWGLKNEVENIDTIATEPFEFTDVKKTIITQVKLNLPSQKINAQSNVVEANIDVGKLLEHVVYIPVNINGLQEDNAKYFSIPQFVKVKFTATANNYQIKDSTQFRACARFVRNQKLQSVGLCTTPNNINVIDVKPNKVQIIVQKK